jgi:AbiV family abortive infection protein
MATMAGPEAREFWKALMDNASCLVADARLLLEAGSFGRARSLTILAQEELGKALWIHDEFEAAWSCGLQDARTVERLREHGRRHIQKYLCGLYAVDRE